MAAEWGETVRFGEHPEGPAVERPLRTTPGVQTCLIVRTADCTRIQRVSLHAANDNEQTGSRPTMLAVAVASAFVAASVFMLML
jgi:hypothetical protein